MSALASLVFPEPDLLSHGDHMSRKEFIDRWSQMPELKRAELIDGVVYLQPLVSFSHGTKDALIALALGYYSAHLARCRSFSRATWLMTRTSAPQPDQCLCRVGPGSRFRLTGDLPTGVPELAAETCRSSRSYDLGAKLRLYEQAGVPEYLAVVLEGERIEWRVLENGHYRLMKPHRDGTYRSKIFPGLWLHAKAFWKGDKPNLMAAIDRGVASLEP
ncbi:MAG: Uma2 family endonuclease [Bryobacteraceae bacterium]